MANPWRYYRRLILAEGRRSLSRRESTGVRDTYVTSQQGEGVGGDGARVGVMEDGIALDSEAIPMRRRRRRVNSGVFAPQRYFDNLPPAKSVLIQNKCINLL